MPCNSILVDNSAGLSVAPSLCAGCDVGHLPYWAILMPWRALPGAWHRVRGQDVARARV